MSKNEITKTWLSGQKSCTLIIPKAVAAEYGLQEPSHVIVERRKEGILIRRLEI
jgi:bifunctional DNA-binding transcriptional regulator/antitoxin component of YhaV-PrlF toxin-antitoxin module